jgi:hypothetical protein
MKEREKGRKKEKTKGRKEKFLRKKIQGPFKEWREFRTKFGHFERKYE